MTRDIILEALALPSQALVGKRIPKSLLIQNGASTSADRKAIAEGIDELVWTASLKPSTVGIPEYRDAEREVPEIAILSLSLRADARVDRLFELIHRAIPYPVFLVAEQAEVVTVSIATKRYSQGDSSKWVLDRPPISLVLSEGPAFDRFLLKLSARKQRYKNLQLRYEAFLHAIVGYEVELLMGEFMVYEEESTASYLASLESYREIEQELNNTKAEACRESMLSRQVELNLRIKELEVQIHRTRDALKGEGN